MIKFDFTNPEEWHLAALVYLVNPSEANDEFVGYMFEDLEAWNDAQPGSTPFWGWQEANTNCHEDSRFAEKGTCDHCGAHFNYGAAYMTKEGDFAIVGNVCASNKLNLTAHEYRDAKLRTAVKAAKSKAAAEKALDELAPNRRVALDTDHYIVNSIRGNFRKWHSLSLKQWALVKKIAREEAEKAEAKANEPEAVAIPAELLEGRHTISGILLGTKSEPGYAYNTYITKMLVLDDRGFKIWGTLPDAIYEIEKGDRLTFDAAIQVSNKDECFGFFKRPTKACFSSEKPPVQESLVLEGEAA